MARRIRLVLGGRSILRPLLLAAGVFVGLLISCGAVFAAEGISWIAELNDAARQAREQKKLLIVVDFAEDFTRAAGTTRSRNTYSAVTLADKRCRQILDSWFVLTSRSVGYPASISATLPVRGDPKVQGAEHAITYFLTPDGRVLHFLSGFVSTETFVKEATWTLECYADALRFPQEEQPLAVRENHLERIPADNALVLFSGHQKNPSEADVSRILAAARKQREQVLLARLGDNFTAPEAAKLLLAMATHGEVEADQAHVVLSEMPLIRLTELERPAWTVLTGQRFWQSTSRRSALCQWLKSALAKDKPVLLVVAALQPVPAPSKPVLDKVPWPPKSNTVNKLLPLVEVGQLSLDELAALIADASLQSITTPVTMPPRFVVLYPGGMRLEVTTEEEGYTRLGRVLAGAVESAEKEPGALTGKGTGK
ncbi:MAG: hypothetical protein ACR2FY_10115 [Pirellulaceae bacterium]